VSVARSGTDETREMAALLDSHIPALRRFAWSLVRDDHAADDLVQDCLERAVGRWHLRRQDGNLHAWLFAILHNMFVSQRRYARRRGSTTALKEWDGVPVDAVDSEPERRLALRSVLSALAELPDDQRVVLVLVGVEDFSYEEAAKLIGVPVGTVMSRLSRGRERLRRLVEGSRPAVPSLRRVK
jgi:RNA polymerase sigma-70 factor, ECF subfamily